ncbi:ABC transporter ATP-binding protein [Ameyamaea chiangmaiensis]|uniref:ABC transporter ATP-binding protein n=1 Tax=Ameyamaea chiangmaiensis TaxID=442969 RepID=UPI00223225D8|nr:ABC transporter ATP-binding protein [Ameyamaea chiangmaiensis]
MAALTVATRDNAVVIVNDLTLHVRAGEMLALLGESGCGKSMTSLALMRLADGLNTSGRITLLGRDIATLPEKAMSPIRGREIAMIFQNPMSALNPVRSVGQQISETIRRHKGLSRKAARQRAIALLGEVGLADPVRCYDAYAHELSGGMCQRVMIAMAISCDPALLIADEPTTALDVTIQKQIMDLLHALKIRRGMGILMITHDLGVVAAYADRVAVMYAGRVVEQGDVHALFSAPHHPYTRGLMDSMPDLADTSDRFHAIPGMVPELRALPPGCSFAPRCTRADVQCTHVFPGHTMVDRNGFVRCFHPLQVAA